MKPFWGLSSVCFVASCGWGSASPPPLPPPSPVGVGVMHGYMWPQGRVATARFPEIDKSNVPQPHYLFFTASIAASCSLSGQDEVFCCWHKNVFIHRTRAEVWVNGQLNLKPMSKFPPSALLPLGAQNQVFLSFGLVGPHTAWGNSAERVDTWTAEERAHACPGKRLAAPPASLHAFVKS